MHTITIVKKTGHEFEREQGRIYKRVLDGKKQKEKMLQLNYNLKNKQINEKETVLRMCGYSHLSSNGNDLGWYHRAVTEER